MATEVPFGLTFGNPSKYIGSSGIGQAVKTGLLAYGMQKSGLKSWLDDLGKKTPEGSVPPMGASGADMDVYSSGFGGIAPPDEANPNANAFMQQAQNQVGLNQNMTNAKAFTQQAQDQVNLNKSMVPNANGMAGAVAPDMAPAPGVTINPIPDAGFPSDIGHQLLDGNDDWQHSAVNPQAQRDSLVLPQQQTIEPPRLSGNEYQQAPGYGSAKKAAMAMFGMG